MSMKIFKERLAKELNVIGFPTDTEERKKAFSKVFGLSKHTTSSILNGMLLPDKSTLEKISEELEVSVGWLLGETNVKKRNK